MRRNAKRSRRPLAGVPLAALAGLVAIAAAARAEPPAAADCSLPGGASWREHRSRHFTILAPARTRDPARLVRTLEELHAAILAALVAEPVELPGKVRVVLVPTRRNLQELTHGVDVIGLFWTSPRTGEPWILLSEEDAADSVPESVAHELVHHESRYLFPRQPYWFSEGLAQFLEGLARPDAQGRRWAGTDPDSGWIAGDVKLTRVEELFSDPPGDGNGYVTSWVLYRFLWNERSRQLSDFQRRLMEGEAPEDAWSAAFPQWTPHDHKIRFLDNDLARHQRSGRGKRWAVSPGRVDLAFTTGAAATADVHMALLELEAPGSSPLVRTRIRRSRTEEALREQPLHPLAVAERAELQEAPLGAALLEAVAAHPDDGRGWWMLGRATADPADREKALRRAVALWPDGARAHAALAEHLAATGRAREGLRFANRAADLAPWDAYAISTLAGVALELGKCREALVLQARAVEVARDEPGRSGASYGERLAEFRRRCEAAPPR